MPVYHRFLSAPTYHGRTDWIGLEKGDKKR